MPCSIYCLITRYEDIHPAMERVASAGVPKETVTVVFRAGGSWLARKGDDVSELAPPLFWNPPLASLSLWWTLATLGFGAPAEAEASPQRRVRVVVPSTVFEARRQQKRGSCRGS
jgi:hypothetical protein